MKSVQSSSSSLKVHVPGLVEAMALHTGMTFSSARDEHTDNSVDADATKIVFAQVQMPLLTGKPDPKTKKPISIDVPAFCHADNGKGFTAAELNAHHHLHNIKPASKKNGLMGYGGTASECYQSQLKGVSLILSKSAECDQLVTKTVDWEALHKGRDGVSPAHPASAEQDALWTKLRSQFKLDDVFHGTMILVQVPDKFKDVLAPAAVDTHCNEMGMTYYKYLSSNNTAVVVDRDGTQRVVKPVDSLSWDQIDGGPTVHLPKHERSYKQVRYIELWKDSDTGEIRAFTEMYQKRGEKTTPVHCGLTKNAVGKTVLTKFSGKTAVVYPPPKSTMLNRIRMRSSYKASGDPDRPTNSGGKIRLERNGRITQSYDPPKFNDGFEHRLTLEGSNHVVELDHTCDWAAPPEVNKSRSNADNIHPQLWAMVNCIVEKFIKYAGDELMDTPEAHTVETATVRAADSGSETEVPEMQHVSLAPPRGAETAPAEAPAEAPVEVPTVSARLAEYYEKDAALKLEYADVL
jgi:hypothetical protein